MSSRLLATIIIFPIWLILVLVFRKHRQWLLYYLTAAFGLTLQIVFLAEYFGIDQTLVNVASFHVNLISKYIFHIPVELMTQGRFQLILTDGSSSILKLGIECSAILESSIAVSLILFYPLFNSSQKILRALFALVVTYVINIIRLMIIVLMAYKFGSDNIFLAHAGVARLFFFASELLLYWYLMTKPSVKSVGDSIRNGVPIAKTATVGHSFLLRHALGQIAVIIFVLGISIGSFKLSDDWKVAFTPAPRQERPIIYQDETALETTVEKPTSQEDEKEVLGTESDVLDSKEVEGVVPEAYSLYEREIGHAQLIGLSLEHSEPVLVEAYVNGQLANTSFLNPDKNGMTNEVFYQPLDLKKGDWLEIRIYNKGMANDNFVWKMLREE